MYSDTHMVTSLGWTPSNNECYTVSDDKTVLRWNVDGDTTDKVADIDSFCTDLKWYSLPHSVLFASLIIMCIHLHQQVQL